MKTEVSSRKSITSFNAIRAVATLLIVLSHVITCWYSDDTYGAAYFSAGISRMLPDSVIFVLLTRWCLPAFFMMTGALLLNPEKEIPLEKVKRYVIRMLEVLGIFGYAFCLVELVVVGKGISFSYFWKAFLNLLQGKCWGHMWYLYTLIGLYMLLPFLKGFIKAYDERAVLVATAICGILFVGIPTINEFTGLKLTTFDLKTHNGAIFYFMAGYALVHTQWSNRIKKVVPVILGGLMLIPLAVLQVFGYQHGETYKYPIYIWTAVIGCATFWLAVRSSRIAVLGEHPVVLFLSKHSFGIYLMHMLPINLLYKGLHIFPDCMPPVIGECVLWAVATGVSVVGSLVLHKLPVIKKLI